jgi:hypothetical protein
MDEGPNTAGSTVAPRVTRDTVHKIAELEARVAELEKLVRDLIQKGQK